ncbi:MAG: hypothetical protein ACLFVV_06210 [Coleofasciculus sp.]
MLGWMRSSTVLPKFSTAVSPQSVDASGDSVGLSKPGMASC